MRILQLPAPAARVQAEPRGDVASSWLRQNRGDGNGRKECSRLIATEVTKRNENGLPFNFPGHWFDLMLLEIADQDVLLAYALRRQYSTLDFQKTPMRRISTYLPFSALLYSFKEEGVHFYTCLS